MNELEQHRASARILPTIFLLVAAFLTNMVLSRLIATERAEIVDLDATLETPLETFSGVVYCREYDLVDSDVSHKWYAAGIGMIGDDDLRVVRIEKPVQ